MTDATPLPVRQNAHEIVPGVARPVRREDYEPIVRAHMPCRKFQDGELELRATLLLMRDRAMATKRDACEPAWHLLDVVEREASEFALERRAEIAVLREVRRLCSQCVAAARDFDTLYQPRLPLGEGEADGRA